MARKSLRIQPLQYIYDLSQGAMNASPLTAQWPSMNVMVSSNRIVRRWDHEVSRTFASGDNIQSIAIFRTNLGTQYVLVLTETDITKLMGGTSETYQYLTNTWHTGTITGITGAVVTGDDNCRFISSSGLNAGDKFILDSDHTAAGEPDANWATIASVDTENQITLSATYSSYGGVGTTGAYKARKIHSVPSNERWQYASVNGKFCFVNGNVYGQYWNGTDTYSTDLEAAPTYTKYARYCVSYANRLVIADMYDTDLAARNPWKVRWSAEGDPTDWTDTTAGFNDFIDSEEPITGLGVVGSNLVVFKKTSYYLGSRTGEATSPISFIGGGKRGIGLYAPNSLVHVAGTVAWMGLTDFYYLNGDTAESIGGPIREKFFELVADDELVGVFGINNGRYNEVLWVANTSVGQYVFVYNWKEKCWTTYKFDSNVSGLGSAGF